MASHLRLRNVRGPFIAGIMHWLFNWRRNICVRDRKSTRLNSSHSQISYAVFCLKKKKKKHITLYAEGTTLKGTGHDAITTHTHRADLVRHYMRFIDPLTSVYILSRLSCHSIETT